VEQGRRGSEEWNVCLEKSRDLKKSLTDAEIKLWANLRQANLGASFRRQHPVPPYIADFACPEKNLIVELDGGQHSEQHEYDLKRTAYLNEQGYGVLRFWNNEVLGNIDGVLETISLYLNNPPSINNPPPTSPLC
jgi:very-short-patch-repair endonuclease